MAFQPVKFVREVRTEVSRVTWPSRKETLVTTGLVFAMAALAALFFFVVDQVIGDHQTVIKSLSKLHADVEMLSGATILGDGAVALILDIPHLVEFGQAREESQRAAG